MLNSKKSSARGQRSRPLSAGFSQERVWILVLFVMAWVQRIFFLQSNSDHDWAFSIFYEGDAETFYDYARCILAGVPYDSGIPFHPPGFPYFLSLIHELVGAGAVTAEVPQEAVRAIVAGAGAAVVPALYVVARPFLGRAVASVAGVLCIFHFGMNVLSVSPTSESLYLVLLLVSLALWTRLGGHPWGVPGAASTFRTKLAARPRLRLFVGLVLGVLLGLLSLTRAEGISIALLLLLIGSIGGWISARRDTLIAQQTLKSESRSNASPTSSSTRAWLAVWIGLVLVLVPWTIRNARHLSAINTQMATSFAEPIPTFVPLTIYGPLNFALGNNELSTGNFSRAYLSSQSGSASLDLRDPQHLHFILHGYKIGSTYILENPVAWGQLVIQKWKLYFGALRLGFTQWNLPGGLDGVRERVDIFVPDNPIAVWLSLPWLMLGVAVLLRSGTVQRRWLVLVMGHTTLGAVTTAFFFGYARLGLLCMPFWLSLMAAAIVWIFRLVFRQRTADAEFFRSKEFRVLITILTALLAIEAWGAVGNRDFTASGSQFEEAAHLNPHDPMRLTVIRRGESEDK